MQRPCLPWAGCGVRGGFQHWGVCARRTALQSGLEHRASAMELAEAPPGSALPCGAPGPLAMSTASYQHRHLGFRLRQAGWRGATRSCCPAPALPAAAHASRASSAAPLSSLPPATKAPRGTPAPLGSLPPAAKRPRAAPVPRCWLCPGLSGCTSSDLLRSLFCPLFWRS